MYTDNQRKFVCVLNRNANAGVLQNASLHAMAGLIAKIVIAGKMDDTKMLEYHQYGNLPSVILSTFPVIVLRSKNSSQLNDLRVRAETTQSIFCNYFTSAMNAGSADEQRERTRSTPMENQEFLAVILFSDSETLAPLTKKFSIYIDAKPIGQPVEADSESAWVKECRTAPDMTAAKEINHASETPCSADVSIQKA